MRGVGVLASHNTDGGAVHGVRPDATPQGHVAAQSTKMLTLRAGNRREPRPVTPRCQMCLHPCLRTPQVYHAILEQAERQNYKFRELRELSHEETK